MPGSLADCCTVLSRLWHNAIADFASIAASSINGGFEDICCVVRRYSIKFGQEYNARVGQGGETTKDLTVSYIDIRLIFQNSSHSSWSKIRSQYSWHGCNGIKVWMLLSSWNRQTVRTASSLQGWWQLRERRDCSVIICFALAIAARFN